MDIQVMRSITCTRSKSNRWLGEGGAGLLLLVACGWAFVGLVRERSLLRSSRERCSMAGTVNEPRLSGTAMGTLPERLRPGTGLLETEFKKLPMPPIPRLDLEQLLPEVS